MAGVFLSYRRRDGDYAVLLYAWLTERFGAEQVFWDREDIDPGSDFREVLAGKLRDCDALVALIGPGWSPSPWIQREIRATLRRKILVLPVLVGDVRNLERASLPVAIRKLASLQALETRDLRFRDRFMEALERVAGTRPAQAAQAAPAAPVRLDDVRARRLVDLLRSQTDGRQRRALELLVAGQEGDALDVLNETFELVMALIDFQPGDPSLELRLGYLYKDLAQIYERTDHASAARYVQSGLQTFQRLVTLDLPPDDLAGSWNGLGNMHLLREDYDQAVECCRRAVEISPDYSYAWSDLFMAYDGQAQRGRVDLAGMRRALARLKVTARGDSLLEPAIGQWEASLRRWESAGPTARPRARRASR